MPKRKLHGGHAQQLEQLREQEEIGPSALARILVQKWSWGALSAPELQEIANAAYEDGLQHPEIYKLASLGRWGQYPGNLQRDLLAQMDTKTSLSTYSSVVDLRLEQKTGVWIDTPCTFMLPHKLFPTSTTTRTQPSKLAS